MQKLNISGEIRETTGKVANKKLRASGIIPAVIYGGEENINFTTTREEVKSIVYTPDFKLAVIELDGNTHECILKEIQFHPVTDEIVHIDFLRLIPGKMIKYEVPVKFFGVSPGVKAGGKLMQHLRKVKVKSTPEVMVDSLRADISSLKLGSAIRVRDIETVEGLQIDTHEATPIAIVEVPRALKDEDEKVEETTVVEEAVAE